MAAPSKDEKDKAEIARLRSKHGDFEAMEPEWRFFLRSYEGGQAYVGEDTLHSHVREHDADYADRLKRSHYQNFCQPLTDFVPDFIYASDIEREAGTDLSAQFDAFIKNVNRAGTTMTDFMRELAEESRIYGHMLVQVDKPVMPADVKTNGRGRATVSVAEARRLRLEPYLIKVCPLEVYDWVTDADGNYLYLKRRQIQDELVGRSRRTVERFTEWYQDTFLVSRVDVSDSEKPLLLDQIEHPNTLGKVPYVKVVYKKSKANRDLSVSFLADIAHQNNSVFNLTSLIDEFLYRQCFNVLTMPANSQVATRDTVEGVIGTSNVLEYPNDAKHEPSYLSPPAEPAEFIQSERTTVIEGMYRTAAQDIASELMAGSNRSGDASKQAFGRQVPVIARQADALQQAEHQIFSLWAELQGKKWDGKIAYKDDYSVTSMMDLILQFTSIFNSARILSPTFVREEWKRLIREYDGKLTPEVRAKIASEIEKVSDDDIIEMIKGPAQDAQASEALPSAANLQQGKAQSGSTDKRRSLRTGDRSATKEAVPDKNKRAKQAAQ